jgi:cell division protein FtsA
VKSRQRIITGLDIGSSKISAVAARIERSGELSILTQATCPSVGVSRGSITDLSKAAGCVGKALSKINKNISQGPGEIYANISGSSLKGAVSKGMIPISLRGREITRHDMSKCVNAGSTINLPFERDVVHRIVHNFSVDDGSVVSSPLGLYASRLYCEVYIITADTNHIQNIYKCVSLAGYDVNEVVLSGIADGFSLLDEKEKEDGALIIDMGDSLTEAYIFRNGTLHDFEIIPMGAREVKGELMGNFELNAALDKISERTKAYTASGGKISSVVITGGLAFTDGIAEIVESKISYPVKMGVATEIKGDISSIDSVRLTTAIGLARYAHQKHIYHVKEALNPVRNVYSKLTDLLNDYF